MPIRALVSGREVIAPRLDSEEWAELKLAAPAGRGVLLPCCDSPGFLRTSKLGTNHFVHKSGRHCDSGGETVEHLWAKAEVVAACLDAGWEATPEVAGEGWRADVLASRGSARIAFEIQWIPQDDETTRYRQERYALAGVRGCWLQRLPEPDFYAPPPVASADLPLFKIVPGNDEGAVAVEHGGERYTVREFVGLLLSQRVRFSPTLRTRLKVCFVDMPCWRCGVIGHFYYARQMSVCGHAIAGHVTRSGEVDNNVVDPFDPAVRSLVEEWLASDGSSAGVSLGEIKPRYSKTANESYMSFGCADCDAIFGEWFVRREMLDALYDEDQLTQFEAEAPFIAPPVHEEDEEESAWDKWASEAQAHWCVMRDGAHCCSTSKDASNALVVPSPLSEHLVNFAANQGLVCIPDSDERTAVDAL